MQRRKYAVSKNKIEGKGTCAQRKCGESAYTRSIGVLKMHSRRIFFAKIISEGGISPVNAPLDSAAADARREFALKALSLPLPRPFSSFLSLFPFNCPSLLYSPDVPSFLFLTQLPHFLFTSYIPLFILFICSCWSVEKESVPNEGQREGERERESELHISCFSPRVPSRDVQNK